MGRTTSFLDSDSALPPSDIATTRETMTNMKMQPVYTPPPLKEAYNITAPKPQNARMPRALDALKIRGVKLKMVS